VPDLWTDLLACLDLRPSPPAEDADDPSLRLFEGSNQHLEYHRLFGGQLLAQFARAAALTHPDKGLKSLHALFPREGRAGEPVRYEVTTHHQGRAFATLTIAARQSTGVIATAAVSMHAPEEGIEHQAISPPPPLLSAEHQVVFDLIPWETRAADDLDVTAGRPEFEFWMKTPEVDEHLAPALAAYATDLNLIGTALRPIEGVSQRGTGTVFASAVTSHTLWFHRPFRTDRWLLLRQQSPVLAHGRCFGRGDVLTEDGSLVASYAQEALLRFKS
jgi:acyl-CoA thioesterase-2